MACATFTRKGVAEMSKNKTPAQKTIPSAIGHGICLPTTKLIAKKALRPIPGATAYGRFAYKPIKSVIENPSSTVAVSTPEKAIPVPDDRIDGLTTTI
jgi:hypothetical protein